MIYPEFKLSGVDRELRHPEFPEEPERGAFIEVRADAGSVRVRIDRFSRVIFYYAVWKDQLYGATTLAGLPDDLPADFPRKLDCEAAIQFVRANSMIGERTLMSGVKRLPPGGQLRYDIPSGELQIDQWWRLPGEADDSFSFESALDTLHEGFRQAIQKAIEEAETIGIHLSGGMDSRQVFGELLAQEAPFAAFTYGMGKNLDVRIARELAAEFDVEHVVKEWDGLSGFIDNFETQRDLTDGMQALIHGHGIDMYEEESQRVDALVIGHFVDLFMQAHMYDGQFETDGAETEEQLYRLFDGGPCSVARWDHKEKEILEREHIGCYRASMLDEIRRLDYMSAEKRYDALYFLHHGLRRLLPQCQAASRFLPCRLPGLDPAFFDVAWSIPGRLKKGRGMQERLLAERYPDSVGKVPIVMDNTRLRYIGGDPGSERKAAFAAAARKIGLLPRHYDYYGREIRRLAARDLYPWMKEQLEQSPLRDAGIFRQDFYDSMLADVRFRRDLDLSVYSSLVSLHGFIEKYGVSK